MSALFSNPPECLSWAKMRWPEIQEAADAGAMVIVPTAAIEEHGPHLPVDTDIVEVEEIALRAAQQIQKEFPVLVTPTVWTGYVPMRQGHKNIVGTLSVRPETFLHIIVETCESIIQHGFYKIVIVCGHGENEGLLHVASLEIVAKLSIRVPVVTWWKLLPDSPWKIPKGDYHSGARETSLQLLLQPDLVRKELGVRSMDKPWTSFELEEGTHGPLGVYVPWLHTSGGFGPLGYAGDPSIASAEKGACTLEETVSALVRFLRDYWRVADIWRKEEAPGS